MDKLAKEKVRIELKLQAFRYKRRQQSIKHIDSDIKSIFELSFNKNSSEGLLKEWVNQCKLEEVIKKDFFKKKEWFIKNWMTEKPVTQQNSEKGGNNNKQYKRSTQYKTFHWQDLIRNQNNNFKHRNNRNNFYRRFQNNFDRRNHYPSRRHRKQPFEIQGNEEHQDIPKNMTEDSLVDILAAIQSRTFSTESIIVPETQQKNKSFLLQTPSH